MVCTSTLWLASWLILDLYTCWTCGVADWGYDFSLITIGILLIISKFFFIDMKLQTLWNHNFAFHIRTYSKSDYDWQNESIYKNIKQQCLTKILTKNKPKSGQANYCSWDQGGISRNRGFIIVLFCFRDPGYKLGSMTLNLVTILIDVF